VVAASGWVLSFVVDATSGGFDRHRSLIATALTGRCSRITDHSRAEAVRGRLL